MTSRKKSSAILIEKKKKNAKIILKRTKDLGNILALPNISLTYAKNCLTSHKIMNHVRGFSDAHKRTHLRIAPSRLLVPKITHSSKNQSLLNVG